MELQTRMDLQLWKLIKWISQQIQEEESISFRIYLVLTKSTELRWWWMKWCMEKLPLTKRGCVLGCIQVSHRTTYWSHESNYYSSIAILGIDSILGFWLQYTVYPVSNVMNDARGRWRFWCHFYWSPTNKLLNIWEFYDRCLGLTNYWVFEDSIGGVLGFIISKVRYWVIYMKLLEFRRERAPFFSRRTPANLRESLKVLNKFIDSNTSYQLLLNPDMWEKWQRWFVYSKKR